MVVITTTTPLREPVSTSRSRAELIFQMELSQASRTLPARVGNSQVKGSGRQILSMFLDSRLPFWIHALLELPAALNFLLKPSEQLSLAAPQAHAIIQQYGVLLFVSAVIAFIFARRPVDATSRRVSAALALYHLAPLSRAISRIRAGNFGYGQGLGGPWVHLVAHSVTFLGLAQFWARGRSFDSRV